MLLKGVFSTNEVKALCFLEKNLSRVLKRLHINDPNSC